MKSSGWAGKNLNFRRDFKVPGSNVACAPFVDSFSLCFSTPRLSEIIRAGGRDFLRKGNPLARTHHSRIHTYTLLDVAIYFLQLPKNVYNCCDNSDANSKAKQHTVTHACSTHTRTQDLIARHYLYPNINTNNVAIECECDFTVYIFHVFNGEETSLCQLTAKFSSITHKKTDFTHKK